MDSAFIPFQHMVEKILDIQGGELFDEDSGIHFFIEQIEVGTPIELDIMVDENGKVAIGAVPPLYRLDTSFRPSYHQVTLRAEKTGLSPALSEGEETSDNFDQRDNVNP